MDNLNQFYCWSRKSRNTVFNSVCSKIHNKKAVKMICYISFFLVKLIYLKGVNEIIELFLGSAKNT